MTEIKIMSIQDLLHIPHLRSSFKVAIMFVTTKPDYYNFGWTDFHCLKIADTDTPRITKGSILALKRMIKIGQKFETIYVCCDAGLSRSPAVALFLAHKLEETKQALEIDERYCFLNDALYKRLVESIK